ncbi:MAG: 30S ribosomal protein S2 [Candidatus Saccharimonadales bacterium]
MSSIDIKTLLEAGAHFGHKTSRWNPKMAPYIHSKRGGIHIIDLDQTVTRLETALNFIESVAASGKKVLFVGTKKHIAPTVQAAAEASGMPYVTQRWFGGMLTNFTTISERVKRLKQLNEELESGELNDSYNKREVLEFSEERDKLAKDFNGILEMDKVPGALFVSDVLTEKTAIREATRLGIPVIAIVDTNGDPGLIDYVIPANDDAVKAVKLIADAVSEAIKGGAKEYAHRAAQEQAAQEKAAQAAKAKSEAEAKKQAEQEQKAEEAKAKEEK